METLKPIHIHVAIPCIYRPRKPLDKEWVSGILMDNLFPWKFVLQRARALSKR